MPLSAAFAPTLQFERLTAGPGSAYAPLPSSSAIPELDAAAPVPDMDFGADPVEITQSGTLYVRRGKDFRASDRVTYQGRKFVLMGAKNWDMHNPLTGRDMQWMSFGLRIDPAQLVTDVLAVRGEPITLIPGTGTVIEKPSGGKDYGPGVPRSAQLFAKFNVKPATEASQTDRGTTRRTEFQMVGSAAAIVELGDHWEDGLGKYTVESVERTPFQVTLKVVAFLKTAGHSFATS